MNELTISYFGIPERRDEALKLQKGVLALRRKVNGVGHPETLRAMDHLAGYLNQSGRRNEALEMKRELLDLSTKFLGETHPDTCSVLFELADLYLASGRWNDACRCLTEWSAKAPENALGSLKLCALQSWLHKNAKHIETCRKALQKANGTQNAATADRTARGYCLVPSSDPRLLEAAATLARRATDLGRDDPWLRWYQLGLGMAEYRQDKYLAADKALLAAIRTLAAPDQAAKNPGSSYPVIEVTANMYHAMSLCCQGKEAEARELFAAAEAQMNPLPVEGQPVNVTPDHDDLICWLAYKEAKALLESKQ